MQDKHKSKQFHGFWLQIQRHRQVARVKGLESGLIIQ